MPSGHSVHLRPGRPVQGALTFDTMSVLSDAELKEQIMQEVLAQWMKCELTSEEAMVVYSLILMPGRTLTMTEIAREVRLKIAHLGD